MDIKNILLNMRKYRMGLIQTPDQLRFSYLAVLEGAKYIMGDPSVQVLEQYTRPVVFPVFVFVQLGGFFFFSL